MNQELRNKIEALLFVSGEEMSVRKLAQLSGAVSEEDTVRALETLARDCARSGVRLLLKDNKAQLVSAPEYAQLVAQLVASRLDEELTQATLETLACVAYREPVTKRAIDELRGVNSIFSLRNLLMRGLIERVPAREKESTDDCYRTTLDFLKKLGMEKVNDLPNYAVLGSDR